MRTATTPAAAATDPMVPRLHRVQRVQREITDTFTLELEPLDGSDVPRFAAGQFNMLYVFGVGKFPFRSAEIPPDVMHHWCIRYAP